MYFRFLLYLTLELLTVVNDVNKHLVSCMCAVVCRWYRKDSNAVPPRYLLSPISKHLPDFISHDKDLSKAAKARWWEDSDAMQEALESSAERALGADESKKYIISGKPNEVKYVVYK